MVLFKTLKIFHISIIKVPLKQIHYIDLFQRQKHFISYLYFQLNLQIHLHPFYQGRYQLEF